MFGTLDLSDFNDFILQWLARCSRIVSVIITRELHKIGKYYCLNITFFHVLCKLALKEKEHKNTN